MNVLVIHAHTANRGDEAAVKSMVDEILYSEPNCNICISINGITPYPEVDKRVKQIGRFPAIHSTFAKIDFIIAYITKGRLSFCKSNKDFLNALKTCDVVIHAPGGPSIGDIYSDSEMLYLLRLNLVRRMKKPYMFYAPSMGPFRLEKRNKLRKNVLMNASLVLVRDPISLSYIKELLPNVDVKQVMDSAIQHDIDVSIEREKLDKYPELKDFLNQHKKCIGITITDLMWHPKHKSETTKKLIKRTFDYFINNRIEEGYGIVFIPQLYDSKDDSTLMNEFMKTEHTFLIDANIESRESYFQQYIISLMYCCVGMRYHSNIFAAKMGTPFISVSYEQKMKGFMNLIGMDNYCIDLNELSEEILEAKFRGLIETYDEYKDALIKQHNDMKQKSRESTDALLSLLRK